MQKQLLYLIMTEKIYSKILEEFYVVDKEAKKYLFKSNVNYSFDEMEQLKDADPKTMQAIHMIKKRFGGTASKEVKKPDQLIQIKSDELTQYVEK